MTRVSLTIHVGFNSKIKIAFSARVLQQSRHKISLLAFPLFFNRSRFSTIMPNSRSPMALRIYFFAHPNCFPWPVYNYCNFLQFQHKSVLLITKECSRLRVDDRKPGEPDRRPARSQKFCGTSRSCPGLWEVLSLRPDSRRRRPFLAP